MAVAVLCGVPSTRRGVDVSTAVADLMGLSEDQAEEAPSPCAMDGAACLDSECCVAGGSDGLQCYKKNDDWASCAASCEPGVHEPEKEGTWDANGVFQKAQWSCEEVGQRSKPGCG